MGFIKNNATTLKQVKIGTDTSRIHYIKRNGSIEWAKPYNLTVTKGSNVSTLSVYRKSTKVSSGVTSGTSAALSSGNQVFHGDVLHIDATAATGYYITSGTGEITVKSAVTVNPQVGRNQYKFKFEPRLITGASSWLITSEDQIKSYTALTDTALKLPLPVGYDDNTENRTCNKKVNAMGGSLDVLYQGYLFYPNFLNDSLGAIPDEYTTLYPEVKQTNRIMYQADPGIWPGNTEDKNDDGQYIGKVVRIPVNGITTPVYFHKMVGTILTSEQPIPLEITTPSSLLKLSALGSNDINTSKYTANGGSSVVLWSDVVNGCPVDGYPKGTTYKCTIPSSQQNYWTFDSGNNPSGATSKVVNLASWDNTTGFNESDIPTTANIPNVYQKLYNVGINVESSINKVILNSADLSTGYLFLGINGSWQPITSPTSSYSLPYGTTIQLARNHYSNMTGFTYNSDATSETKTITVNGTSYTVDVYSKSYTVNANNMNIPFYVTPNSYTITCNIGMGISSFNFSTTSKYGTALSNQSYSSSKSFTVHYKDTCSYNGVVKTGFENATPSVSGETVSTKTVTFTASPKLFRVTVSTGSATGITVTFERTSSPYKGAATGKLTSGYNANNVPLTNGSGITFGNNWSFDAYYGDVFSCTPTFKVSTPTNASLTMQTKYIDYTSSRTISEATTWSIVPKESNITAYFTNTKFFNSDSQYLKYCRHGMYTNSSSFSAGTNKDITIDSGTPVYMYTCCKASQNPGNSSCPVHNLGSNNPGAYVGTCYSQYSTSLTMSSFSKITALPYNNENIEVVPAQTKESGDFYLTLAPIIKTFIRGYGVATTLGSVKSILSSARELQYSGSNLSGSYDCPHSETYSGSPSVINYTILITSVAVLHSGTTKIETKWNCGPGLDGKVFYNNRPDLSTSRGDCSNSVANTDSTISGTIVPTYGAYASVTVSPYLSTYYYSFGWKYALYWGNEKKFRTYRRKYDGTNNDPGIGYTASGNGAVSNIGSYLYYSGTTGSISSVSSYLRAGSGLSMYDSLNVSLSRNTFIGSSTGSDPNKYSLSDAKFYAIFDFNSTSDNFDSKLKKVLDDKLIIDYVYNYKTNNY